MGWKSYRAKKQSSRVNLKTCGTTRTAQTVKHMTRTPNWRPNCKRCKARKRLSEDATQTEWKSYRAKKQSSRVNLKTCGTTRTAQTVKQMTRREQRKKSLR